MEECAEIASKTSGFFRSLTPLRACFDGRAPVSFFVVPSGVSIALSVHFSR